MKKKVLLINTFLFGVSFNSYAGTGNASDMFELFLFIGGLLLIFLGLIAGVDFLQKQGKTMIHNAMSFLKKKMIMLREYLHQVKSHYSDLSYF